MENSIENPPTTPPKLPVKLPPSLRKKLSLEFNQNEDDLNKSNKLYEHFNSALVLNNSERKPNICHCSSSLDEKINISKYSIG